MPFPYTAAAASVRNRRVKEKDGRGVSASSSSRRQRDVSRVNDNRSPAPSHRSPRSSLYSQQNITLDQLPPLPSSGTASPSSAASPTLQPSQVAAASAGIFHLAHPPYTPAALQGYLDEEPSSDPSVDTSPVDVQDDPTVRLHHQTDQPKSPVPGSYPEASPSSALGPLHQTNEDNEDNLPQTLSEAHSLEAPVRDYVQASPQLFSPTPLSPQPAYLASPPAFAPAGPWQGGYPTDHFFTSPYARSPPIYGMAQPSGLTGEGQQYPIQPMPYFAEYGSAHPVPTAYSNTRGPPLQGYAVPSRSSISGYPSISASIDTVEAAGHEVAVASSQVPDDDAGELLHRIQSAIPDLHLLLNRYKETSGQLGIREGLMRQSEAQKAEALRQKETYIDRLGKELESASQKYSAESSKLRLEIGNLEEKHRELQDEVIAKQKSMDQLEAANQTLLKKTDLLGKQHSEALEAAKNNYKQWKDEISAEYESKEKAIKEELQRKTKAAAILQAKFAERESNDLREREDLKATWARERKEIEIDHDKITKVTEAALRTCRIDLEKSKRKEREGQEAWESERQALNRKWDEERVRLSMGWGEQLKILEARHLENKEKMQKNWEVAQEQSGRQREEENTELRKEIERLKLAWDRDKITLTNTARDLGTLTARLTDENSSLKKMVDAFGEATDFRSRGDAYFIDVFAQLRKQISELGMERCKGALERTPERLLKDLPAEIPDFLADTPASIRLRAAYVQHTISRILCYRIFQPFLFTLSRRHEAADRLFQAMSQKLRHDSFRREAFWRQQTLHAAYTVSSAKQSINKIAAVIVEEIMEELQYLTCPNEREQTKAAIRRIVKNSAESWRYARLEREMITASMPSVQHPSMSGPGALDGTVTPSTGSQDALPRAILPLLPHISREPTHRDFSADSNRVDTGCMYSQGTVLYSNSAIVIARLAEIKQASTNPADLRRGESPLLSTNSPVHHNSESESANDSSRSPKENGPSPVDAEIVAREGRVKAPAKDAFNQIEEAKNSPDTTGTASDQSAHRQLHPAGRLPPIEARPKGAVSSGVIAAESTRW